MKGAFAAAAASLLLGAQGQPACPARMSSSDCAAAIAREIVAKAKGCYQEHPGDQEAYEACAVAFCGQHCGAKLPSCRELCVGHANPLFAKFAAQGGGGSAADARPKAVPAEQLRARIKAAAAEEAAALTELQEAQGRMKHLNSKMAARAEKEIRSGDAVEGRAVLAKASELTRLYKQIDEHLASVRQFRGLAQRRAPMPPPAAASFLQRASGRSRAPEDDLAKEMTHDLEMNFNKIAPFGKEDTAKELQDHAAKTQDTLVDAVENAEVAEIKRAVFRALTRLRAATIKEFDTIARLETQAIDAYNDAHHYRAENPLAHLHEDEAPVETDKLKSFH